MKAFEMADTKCRITSEIDVSGNNSLAVLGIGVSDFHHSYFPMLYSIVRSENKRSVFPPMKINMEIMKKLAVKLRKQYPITYAILKDGGPSFVRPSIELNYDQEDCIVHKLCPPNHKTYRKKKFNGKGHRGSIYKFLESKKVSTKNREAIAYQLLCLHATSTSNLAYNNAQLLFIRDLCTDFMREIKEPPLFEKYVSGQECMEYLMTNYGHIISRIDVDEESDKKPSAKGSVRKYNDLSRGEQIVVHIVNTYAPLKCRYGPKYADGSVSCTNGLESNWCKEQLLGLDNIQRKGYKPIQSLFNLVQKNTTIPDDLCTKPLQLASQWSNVLQYCDKPTPKQVLPEYLSHIIAYDNTTNKLIARKPALYNALTSIDNYPNGLTLYVPTEYNFETTLKEVTACLINADNPSGFARPQSKNNKSSNDAKKLFWPLYNSFSKQLHSKYLYCVPCIDFHPFLTFIHP